jgi:hypothetical protein
MPAALLYVLLIWKSVEFSPTDGIYLQVQAFMETCRLTCTRKNEDLLQYEWSMSPEGWPIIKTCQCGANV